MKTALTHRFGIEHPIMSAGMARVAQAPLVVAVSEAGGMGCLGGVSYLADALRDEIRTIREGTAKPFAVNLLVPPSLVDEDAEVLKVARLALEEGGLEVHTLDNPLLVAQTIRRLDIDLVLLETELSTMKGAVVIQSLRNHGLARVPVMLHSKLDANTLKARAKEVGAQGFIRKGSTSLLREVDAFLGSTYRVDRT